MSWSMSDAGAFGSYEKPDSCVCFCGTFYLVLDFFLILYMIHYLNVPPMGSNVVGVVAQLQGDYFAGAHCVKVTAETGTRWISPRNIAIMRCRCPA